MTESKINLFIITGASLLRSQIIIKCKAQNMSKQQPFRRTVSVQIHSLIFILSFKWSRLVD